VEKSAFSTDQLGANMTEKIQPALHEFTTKAPSITGEVDIKVLNFKAATVAVEEQQRVVKENSRGREEKGKKEKKEVSVAVEERAREEEEQQVLLFRLGEENDVLDGQGKMVGAGEATSVKLPPTAQYMAKLFLHDESADIAALPILPPLASTGSQLKKLSSQEYLSPNHFKRDPAIIRQDSEPRNYNSKTFHTAHHSTYPRFSHSQNSFMSDWRGQQFHSNRRLSAFNESSFSTAYRREFTNTIDFITSVDTHNYPFAFRLPEGKQRRLRSAEVALAASGNSTCTTSIASKKLNGSFFSKGALTAKFKSGKPRVPWGAGPGLRVTNRSRSNSRSRKDLDVDLNAEGVHGGEQKILFDLRRSISAPSVSGWNSTTSPSGSMSDALFRLRRSLSASRFRERTSDLLHTSLRLQDQSRYDRGISRTGTDTGTTTRSETEGDKNSVGIRERDGENQYDRGTTSVESLYPNSSSNHTGTPFMSPVAFQIDNRSVDSDTTDSLNGFRGRSSKDSSGRTQSAEQDTSKAAQFQDNITEAVFALAKRVEDLAHTTHSFGGTINEVTI